MVIEIKIYGASFKASKHWGNANYKGGLADYYESWRDPLFTCGPHLVSIIVVLCTRPKCSFPPAKKKCFDSQQFPSTLWMLSISPTDQNSCFTFLTSCHVTSGFTQVTAQLDDTGLSSNLLKEATQHILASSSSPTPASFNPRCCCSSYSIGLSLLHICWFLWVSFNSVNVS